MKNNFIDDYICYLSKFVCDEYHYRKYQRLLCTLFSYPFEWSMVTDEARALDGLRLREKFMKSYQGPIPNGIIFPEQCTMLEMMVGLSIRCEDEIMSDYRYGDRTSEWFWRMVRNANLNKEDDEEIDENFVKQRLIDINNHCYGRDGRGSFFYCPTSRRDFRKMDLWEQMCHYLNMIISDN